jgi:hypothetical protein
MFFFFQEVDMSCLIEAFKQMRRGGLVAERQCYGEDCGRKMMLRAAQRLRAGQRDVPVFLDPARMRAGSPVNFTADHVYPAEKRSGRRVRR